MRIWKEKKGFFLILIVIFILAAACAMAVWQYLNSGAGTVAKIFQNGELIREVDLTHVDSPYSFTVQAADGGFNTIQVEQGKIGIIDADCPDKICQNMGMVSSTAYPISCLPHRLMIRIEKGKKNSEGLDAFTG